MGNCVVTVVQGSRSRNLIGAGTTEEYICTVAPGSASSDYATGGQPFVLPADIKGAKVDAIMVVASTPQTRVWKWDGSTSSPKLMAHDGFATEEGAGTTVNTDTVTCLLRVRR